MSPQIPPFSTDAAGEDNMSLEGLIQAENKVRVQVREENKAMIRSCLQAHLDKRLPSLIKKVLTETPEGRAYVEKHRSGAT